MRARILASAILAALAFCGAAAPPAEAAQQSGKAAKRPDKPQAEKDKRVWLLGRADDTVALSYGLPGSPDPSFAISCQPRARLLLIAVEVNSKAIRSGDGVPLALANGRRHLELAASAFLSGPDGRLVVEAAVALEERVLNLFRDGDTLTMKVPGATASFPISGARSRLGDFERACFGRK